MVSPSKSACGSKEFNAPFPVSPSGGKPGRAGSPHAGSTLRASKGGWHVAMLPAPPTRGLPPPCASPACASGICQKLCGKGEQSSIRLQRPDGDGPGKRNLRMAATSALTFTTFS